jgi:AsmA protein
MRIFLWGLAAIVIGLVLLVVAVVLLFDPNNFRGRISAEVEGTYHRKLEIGDIRLSLFPTLGAHIKDLKLDNAQGFGAEPMARVGEAEVGVRILPLLFDQRAEISSITLKDLRLQLQRNAEGRSNWDDFTNPPGKQPPAPAKPGQPPAPQPPHRTAGGALQIGSIDIDNANISYVDQQAKKSYAVSRFRLSTGAIKDDKPFDFKLAFSAALADPAVNADVQVSARLGYAEASKVLVMQNLEAVVDAAGAGVPGGKQNLKLQASVYVDGGKGSFKLDDGRLSLANLAVALKLDGSGLDGGDDGRINGTLAVASFDPRETFKALGITPPVTADAAALKQASFNANIHATRQHPRLDNIVLKLDQSTLSGSAGLNGEVAEFVLKLDQIDADRYLPPPQKRNPVASSAGGGSAGEGDNAPLPLNKLDGFSASGSVDIGKLKLKNLSLAGVQLKLAADKGAQKTLALTAALYGGTLSSSTRLGPGARPALAQALKLSSINAGPLLQDFMGKDYVSGNGNVALDVTSTGNTMGEIKRALNGSASVALQNGAVKGFNLAQLIRQGQSLYQGQSPEQSSAGQQTDFSTLSASGKIANGVLHSDDLAGASPLLRLTGAGQVDLVNSTLDYTVKPIVVNTATGQGGKELASLQGIVIPVHVYGPFAAPKYRLDVGEALKQEAVQKLTQKLGNGQNGQLLNQLQGLFGKKKQ